MNQENRYASLRESTLASIGDFLFEEKFEQNPIIKDGILEIINLISDCYEEGVHLFPEVIVINDLNFFKAISNREIVIRETELTISEFENVIKLCAPLTVGSWIIFIEIKNNTMKYGLVDAEITETTPSIYEQTVGALLVDIPDMTVAYIRNVGSKTVELVGLKKKLTVSLTLGSFEMTANNVVYDISKQITNNCDPEFQQPITTFIDKIINSAIKQNHGNLIGVVEDDPVKIETLKEKLKDGVYLKEPIDIADYVIYTEKEETNESSVSLKAYSRVMVSMLNHDGITLISDKAKILGYHMFIESVPKEGEQLVGGARTRAFQSMLNSELFNACFYKSQDGNSKIWIKK